MPSGDLGDGGFGEPGVDAGLELGVAGDAALDAGEPLDGDPERAGNGVEWQANGVAQLT